MILLTQLTFNATYNIYEYIDISYMNDKNHARKEVILCFLLKKMIS